MIAHNIRGFTTRGNRFSIALVCALIFLAMQASKVTAQDTTQLRRDTVVVENQEVEVSERPDTVTIKSYAKRFSPRKAILYAAVLPGLGQAYNKKYWKLPLVYGGFYAIGYYIKEYNDIYTEYKGYLFYNLEHGLEEDTDENPTTELNTGQLRSIVDDARRERDLMIILFGGMYLLQMIDAHVDSHLKEFDLNPKLQVSIEPSMDQNQLAGRTMGVALVMRFK